MTSIFFQFSKVIFHRFPLLQPIMDRMYQSRLRYKINFRGWGMTSAHELPWNDEQDWHEFKQACIHIKNNFDFGNNSSGIQNYNVDDLMWRNWIISFCTRYAKKLVKTDYHNFVECGVGIGVSSFLILNEFLYDGNTNIKLHLYDSWGIMQKESLMDSELEMVGTYSKLDIKTTKKNLSKFLDYTVFHQGYIPQSLHSKPESPNFVSFLHIDLNSVNATRDALDFFYPKLADYGLILFDDYGWIEFSDTRKAIDLFFKDKPGLIMKLPTGQSIYFHTKKN